MVLNKLSHFLKEPLMTSHDIDSSDYTLVQRQLIQKKPLLYDVYKGFYTRMMTLDTHYLQGNGKQIEIGAGCGIVKDFFPSIITTDVKKSSTVNIQAMADNLPFKDHSLRSIWGVFVFHHLPDVHAFFNECLRVLEPGGGIILIEPYYSVFARHFYKHLHDFETFDMSQKAWDQPLISSPMRHANQALSYNVFFRDRDIFNDTFPSLEMVHQHTHSHIHYLCSGGMNFRQLVPSFFNTPLKTCERFLSFLNPLIALCHTLIIKKRK